MTLESFEKPALFQFVPYRTGHTGSPPRVCPFLENKFLPFTLCDVTSESSNKASTDRYFW